MILIYILLIAAILCVGGLFYLIRVESRTFLKLLLAFSAAFLIGISFIHILPEIYESHSVFVGLFVLLGFILQLVIELLTRGAEHGHEHDSEECRKAGHISPFLLMTGLSIHSFLEGMPIVEGCDPDLRRTLVTGIVIHNIPITITLLALFLHYGMSVRKAFFLLLVFALMTPLGSVASRILQHFTVSDLTIYFTCALAMVVGIFLHVSTSILFETEESHQYNFQKFATIFVGIAVAFGVSMISHVH
jgi:zinc transporter ZupT